MILRTLLAHYRRHPVQGLFLLAGIVMANALLVGTQLINAQARASYAEGEKVLGAGPAARILPRGEGRAIEERRFVELRRQGFDMVAPMLREVLRTADGELLEVLGVDGLSMPRRAGAGDGSSAGGIEDGSAAFGAFSFPPYELWAASTRIEQLGRRRGERIALANGRELPPLRAVAGDDLGHRLLLDLGALQEITGTAGRLSALLVFQAPPERLAALRAALPPELLYRAEADAPDPAQMTRSFHLNLAAMGLLAFVVGLFLTYNAIAFSYTDRRELIRKLRLAGVSRRELTTALLRELALFLLVGGLLGFWLGSLLAARLLPGVGQTLAQLYGVYIAYPDTLLPSGYWLPLAMTGLAGLACAVFPLREAVRAPLLERWSEGWRLASAQRRDRLLLGAGLLLLIAAALLSRNPGSTWLALGGMACLLLGAALCLPAVLRWLLRRLGHRIPPRAVRLGWLLADSRWLLGPASLALMAMTLALVANSGLNTMIGSFRQATDDWLSQRLAAELYLRAEPGRGAPEVAELEAWLAERAPEVGLALRHAVTLEQETPAGGLRTVELIDLADAEPFRSSVDLLRGVPDAAREFRDGRGVYVSERAWRLDGWELGDRIALCPAAGSLTVLGIYHDYGNPRSQWMVSQSLFQACWPGRAPAGIGLYGPEETDWAQLRAGLGEDLGLGDDALIDQRELRAVGLAVFDRTFGVTRALNLLTLLVAGIGIFCAVSAIHHHRVGQQALLASLGLPRLQRGALLLSQWGLLGLLCMVLVWPFGTALAWYLAAVVTPAAFGWSFALRIEAGHYWVLALLAALALVLAVALPSLRLLRVSPAALLREQTL